MNIDQLFTALLYRANFQEKYFTFLLIIIETIIAI